MLRSRSLDSEYSECSLDFAACLSDSLELLNGRGPCVLLRRLRAFVASQAGVYMPGGIALPSIVASSRVLLS